MNRELEKEVKELDFFGDKSEYIANEKHKKDMADIKNLFGFIFIYAIAYFVAMVYTYN